MPPAAAPHPSLLISLPSDHFPRHVSVPIPAHNMEGAPNHAIQSVLELDALEARLAELYGPRTYLG
jgi:hypothetical protein